MGTPANWEALAMWTGQSCHGAIFEGSRGWKCTRAIAQHALREIIYCAGKFACTGAYRRFMHESRDHVRVMRVWLRSLRCAGHGVEHNKLTCRGTAFRTSTVYRTICEERLVRSRYHELCGSWASWLACHGWVIPQSSQHPMRNLSRSKPTPFQSAVSQISDAAPAVYRMVWVDGNDVLLVLETPWSRTP